MNLSKSVEPQPSLAIAVAKSVVVNAFETFGEKPDAVIREKRFSLSEGAGRSFKNIQISPSSRNAADEGSRPQKGQGANNHAFCKTAGNILYRNI
ncbi:MAG: hypothetical protein AB1724_02975 [Thermodesulfobacteriota bacterium]